MTLEVLYIWLYGDVTDNCNFIVRARALPDHIPARHPASTNNHTTFIFYIPPPLLDCARLPGSYPTLITTPRPKKRAALSAILLRVP